MNNQSWCSFDNDLRIRLAERTRTRGENEGHIGHERSQVTDTRTRAAEEYQLLTECVKESIEIIVSKQKKLFRNGRSVSEKTKHICTRLRYSVETTRYSVNSVNLEIQ